MDFKSIKWFGQSAIRLKIDNKIIYFDPYKIPNGQELADYIFITHSHSDHFSIKDILKIADQNTVFCVSESVFSELKTYKNKFLMKPYDKIKVDAFSVEAVPAYNIIKTKFHPRSDNNLGYLLTDTNGFKIYHTGDTELIPEMNDIYADLLFLPLGQVYTMNSVEDAVALVKIVKAKYVFPFHYGMYEGTKEDKDRFNILVNKNASVTLLNP